MAVTDEIIDTIQSEEELDEVLGTGKAGEGEQEENEDQEEDQGEEKQENDEEGEEKKSKPTSSTSINNESEEDFENIVDYVNKNYDLGLNIKNLPKNLSRQQEAEVISDLFGNLLSGVNNKLKEYSEIESILEDQEVKAFIEDKRKTGKSLKDYISQYASTVEGSEDEAVVKRITKMQYPDMDDNDINDIVEGYKDKGKLEKMAEIARTNLKRIDEQNQQLELQNFQNEVKEFNKFVTNIPNVYGVPLTKEMKDKVVRVSTERDENGETYLDKVLSTNEGVFLASLAVTHLKDLMSAKATTKVNKAQKRLIDRLYDKVDGLQSGSQEQQESGFSVDVANAF